MTKKKKLFAKAHFPVSQVRRFLEPGPVVLLSSRWQGKNNIMCRNLARKSGLEVLAADRDDAPLKRLAADGVKSASIDEIAAECRIIM